MTAAHKHAPQVGGGAGEGASLFFKGSFPFLLKGLSLSGGAVWNQRPTAACAHPCDRLSQANSVFFLSAR